MIPSRSFEIETLLDRNYSNVDETVGKNVDNCNLEWNVTPLIRRGSNFVFFAVLYCSCIVSQCVLGPPSRCYPLTIGGPAVSYDSKSVTLWDL